MNAQQFQKQAKMDLRMRKRAYRKAYTGSTAANVALFAAALLTAGLFSIILISVITAWRAQ